MLEKTWRQVHQMQVVIYKNKNQQHGEEAQVVDQEEDQLFMATCFSSMESSES